MLSNPFLKLQVTLNYKTGHVIQWWLHPSFEGPAPYKFTLLSYQDNNFKEVLFEKEVGEQYFAIDDSNLRQNSLNSFLYKVQLVTKDGKTFISDFVGWRSNDGTTRRKYLMASEAVRKEWVGLRMFGEYAYLLKRKSYSPLALGEVDPVTHEPIMDTSQGSYGVGFAGGYFDPLLFKYYLIGHQESTDYDPNGMGANYQEDINIKTVGFPFIDCHDILVSVEGKRYNITKVKNTFFPGSTIIIQQTVDARIIPNTDTTYSISVPAFPND